MKEKDKILRQLLLGATAKLPKSINNPTVTIDFPPRTNKERLQLQWQRDDGLIYCLLEKIYDLEERYRQLESIVESISSDEISKFRIVRKTYIPKKKIKKVEADEQECCYCDNTPCEC